MLRKRSHSEWYESRLAFILICLQPVNEFAGRHVFFPPEGTIPTDVEQATGLEKKEIDALMAGVEVGSLYVQQFMQEYLIRSVWFLMQDPFNMGVNVGPWGTKDKPRLVPSMFDNRIVGCICEFGS